MGVGVRIQQEMLRQYAGRHGSTGKIDGRHAAAGATGISPALSPGAHQLANRCGKPEGLPMDAQTPLPRRRSPGQRYSGKLRALGLRRVGLIGIGGCHPVRIGITGRLRTFPDPGQISIRFPGPGQQGLHMRRDLRHLVQHE